MKEKKEIYLKVQVLLIVLFWGVLSTKIVAQTATGNAYTIIPPSPTAYNLGKHGLFKTGLFTGTVNSEIPLMEYKTRNLTVPISLSYSSNGVKVEDVSSWTGLTWNLNAGGVIIRTVKGNPDLKLKVIPGSSYTAEGMIYPEEVIEQMLAERDAGNALPITLQTYVLRAARMQSNFDTEYDIFSYNFLGKSGKFIITSRGEVIEASKSALRIEPIGDIIDDGFVITDDQGVQYKFNTTETTQISNGPDSRNPSAITSWYLSEIKHPKGDIVTLNYANYSTSISYNGEQSYTKVSGTPSLASFPQFASQNSGYKSGLIQLNAIYGKRLQTISSNSNGTITFFADITNQGQPGVNLLSRLKYEREDGQVLEDINFTYNQTANQRVFLENVQFLEPAKKYQLSYYLPESLPVRTSFSQDHWGFYNGAISNNTLLPRDNDFENLYPGYFTDYANRQPNANTGYYGLLQKIVYPTGGQSIIYYEPNNYYTTGTDLQFSYIDLTSESGTNYSNNPEQSSSVIIPVKDHSITIQTNLLSSTMSECPESQDPEVLRRKGGQIRIYDVTTGRNIILADQDNNYFTQDTLRTLTNGLGERIFRAQLTGGHQYILYVSTRFACSRLTASFSYPSSYSGSQTNEITGGFRVRRIEDVPLSGIAENKYYKYADTLQNDISSLVFLANSPVYFSNQIKTAYLEGAPPSQPSPTTPENQRPPSQFSYSEAKISSSSIEMIYNQSGSHVAYGAVIESSDENAEMGYVLHRFRTSLDGGGQVLSVDNRANVGNMGVTNLAWDNGLESYTAVYKKAGSNFKRIKETFLQYDVIPLRSIPMLLVNQRYPTPCGYVTVPFVGGSPGGATPPPSSICTHEGRFFVSSGNSTADYSYGNCISVHRHKWSPNSAGMLICGAVGSQNLTGTVQNSFNDPGIGSNVNLNSIEPLNIVSYRFNSVLHHLSSKTEVDYDDSGNPLTSISNYTYNDLNHIKATETINSKGESMQSNFFYPTDFTNISIYDLMTERNMTGILVSQVLKNVTNNKGISKQNVSFELQPNQAILQRQITKTYSDGSSKVEIDILKYDDKNNVQEIINKDGIKEVYLWGYGGQYPVAKIIGSDYATVSTIVSQAQIDGTVATDQGLRNLIQTLRTNPATQKAQVFTYTYKPLIGMTSETDASGRTIFYEYDSFGRLSIIKDNEGNIVKKICYNYMGQQVDCNQ